jgi:hypothetical protein
MPYSLDDLRKARAPKPTDDLLSTIPADAPHDTDEAIGCWNGERFVSWKEWLLSRPIEAFIDKNKVENFPAPPPRESKSPTKARNKRETQNHGTCTQKALDICVQMH